MERPLTGEPLALDLVNTAWQQRDGEHDLLASRAGLTHWLAEWERTDPGFSDVAPSEPLRAALLHTRAVLRSLLAGELGAERRLNAILARGAVARSLRDGAIHEAVVVVEPAWRLPWEAANDYLRLCESGGAQSMRRCEQEACVLYFYDPTGRRRWCSMSGCGNRAKAQRHYARTRSRRAAAQARTDNA